MRIDRHLTLRIDLDRQRADPAADLPGERGGALVDEPLRQPGVERVG